MSVPHEQPTHQSRRDTIPAPDVRLHFRNGAQDRALEEAAHCLIAGTIAKAPEIASLISDSEAV
jgi:hypothetical protein